MRPEERDPALLWDMLDAALAIADFVAHKTLDDYRGDRMLRGAVERHLEIIGEAANRVSDIFREAHPAIPWRAIIGQRNVIVHGYAEIEHDLVWRVAAEKIPELIDEISVLIPNR
ncbi:MAG: DUF86 domain-containing protein [Myxococcota bacterium]|jgi:uncharacterized protein with HEPN domain|nr:DUF86 domain-containing protein [Myxococcota bacterium]